MVSEPLNLVKMKGRRLSLAKSRLYKINPGKLFKVPKMILDESLMSSFLYSRLLAEVKRLPFVS